ncbi:MAG: methyltransferase domain-containing protein [Chloroflexota bacterium]|nr:methyltransferase domain-containing protein [Chloroflexota bacterium]
MNLSQIRAVYDRRAPTYDRTVGCGERLLLGELRRAFGAELRGDTLEVAVGSGLNLPHYGPKVELAIGADLSLGMLEQARRRVTPHDRPLALVQMDAQRLAFPTASFDTVAISLALCTVPDPEAALRELARVCKPGGRVVLLEHVRSPHWPIALFQRAGTPLQERFIGCHLTRRTDITLRRLGFTVISERTRLFGIFRLIVASPPSDG